MKQLNQLLFFATIFFISNAIHAQTGSVGIGTTTPNNNASLELGHTNKGLLLNRVALTAANSPAPLAANVAGMVVKMQGKKPMQQFINH